MSGIQTTQHGNTVALNAARMSSAEGGQSIEAQISSVMAMGYDTSVKILKNKVQEYRAQLKLQQKYNDALANIEKMQAGFKDTNASTIRTGDADSMKKAQSAIEKAGANNIYKTPDRSVNYTNIVEDMGVSGTEGTAMKERAALADIAQEIGYADQGANADRNALVKGDMTKGYLDGLKAKIKGAMDSIGADLQMQMIDIQTVKGRMDQFMTAMTQHAKSVADQGQSIARNL